MTQEELPLATLSSVALELHRLRNVLRKSAREIGALEELVVKYLNQDQVQVLKTAKHKGRVSRADIAPAIQVMGDELHRYPAKSWWGTIEATIKDLDRWRAIVHEWAGRGFNPTNVQGMIEAYHNGLVRAKPPDPMDVTCASTGKEVRACNCETCSRKRRAKYKLPEDDDE